MLCVCLMFLCSCVSVNECVQPPSFFYTQKHMDVYVCLLLSTF